MSSARRTTVWPAVAVASALVAFAPANARAEPGFDDQRLFTTPQQRARLDDMRARLDGDLDGPEELIGATGLPLGEVDQPASEPEPEPLSEVRVHGFVQRSGGPPALWIDDASGLETGIERGRIDGDSVVVTLPDGRTIRLKPGQVYDPERDAVVEAYRQ